MKTFLRSLLVTSFSTLLVVPVSNANPLPRIGHYIKDHQRFFVDETLIFASIISKIELHDKI